MSILKTAATQLVLESINDKNIFKAVFLAGGPGSGKSFVNDAIFKGRGVKILNSDEMFEFLLTKLGVSKKIDPNKPEVFAKQMNIRDKAKKLANNKAFNIINGMLPIVIDGTGAKADRILKQKEALEKIGYDTSMVFVNTSLEVAKQRNELRARSVPDDVVTGRWQDVQNNKSTFKSAFKIFEIVNNNEVLKDSDLDKFNLKMAKIGLKILNQPIKNPIGNKIVDVAKSSNGKIKTLSDFLNPKDIDFSI